MDSIVNIFYTQLFQMLCNEADANHDGRLKVPVHIILDDFAANVQIPDFDKIISVAIFFFMVDKRTNVRYNKNIEY